jgi:DNA-directed RNA polymerase subunit RPC12/RpoP
MRKSLVVPHTWPREFRDLYRWPLPRNIRRKGDAIAADPLPRDRGLGGFKWVAAPSVLLEEFVELAGAPGDAILAFAQKYGLLGLCKSHGMPVGHDDYCPKAPSWVESFAAWRQAARYIGALLRLGAAIDHGRRGEDDDWRAALGPDWESKVKVYGRPIAFLIDFNWMLSRWGRLRPILLMSSGRFSAGYGGVGYEGQLASAIARQAFAYVLGAREVTICAECGRQFESERIRNPGRRAFCPDCGRAAAMRAASRDYYKRKKEKLAGASGEIDNEQATQG